MSKSSYAVVSASKVRVACQEWLRDRQARIDREIEELVQGEMSRRFFAAKTREAALKRCADSIDMVKWTGGYWASRVEDILILSKISKDDSVRLNADDASILEDYLK